MLGWILWDVWVAPFLQDVISSHCLSKSFLVGGFNPFETYYIVKLDPFPGRGENKKCLKPPYIP